MRASTLVVLYYWIQHIPAFFHTKFLATGDLFGSPAVNHYQFFPARKIQAFIFQNLYCHQHLCNYICPPVNDAAIETITV